MSGPPKTPSHLRLVRGNPSKRPINKDEPKPPKGVPQLRSISISRVSTGLSEWARN
jgi:hypothetical protein